MSGARWHARFPGRSAVWAVLPLLQRNAVLIGCARQRHAVLLFTVPTGQAAVRVVAAVNRSLLGFDDEDAAAANEGDVEDYSSAAAAPGSTTAPDGSSSSDWAGCIRSGRRANTAGSRGGALLDAERYMDLLDKQKRHTGGVLVSSSIDDPWAQCPSGSSSRSSRSAHTTSSFNSKGVPATPGAVAAAGLGSGSAQPPSGALGISRSSSLWAKADASPSLAAAVAAAAVIGGGGAGEPGQQSAAAATVASGAPAGIMGRRRRSKSAHAWFAN